MKKIVLLLAAIVFMQSLAYSQETERHKSKPAKSIKSKITILNAWVRPAAKGANSAMYFVIQNNEDKPDTLTVVRSKLADIVELHETYKKQDDKTGMRPVKFIAVPAKSKAELKPGGFHVMLLDMVKDFKKGDSFEAVVQFKNAGKIKVNAVVQDTPKMPGM